MIAFSSKPRQHGRPDFFSFCLNSCIQTLFNSAPMVHNGRFEVFRGRLWIVGGAWPRL